MLDSDSDAGDSAVVFLVLSNQFFTTGFLLGLNDSDAGDGEALKTTVLEHSASFREVIACFIGSLLIVFLAFTGWAQEENLAQGVDDRHVLDRVFVLLLLYGSLFSGGNSARSIFSYR